MLFSINKYCFFIPIFYVIEKTVGATLVVVLNINKMTVIIDIRRCTVKKTRGTNVQGRRSRATTWATTRVAPTLFLQFLQLPDAPVTDIQREKTKKAKGAINHPPVKGDVADRPCDKGQRKNHYTGDHPEL